MLFIKLQLKSIYNNQVTINVGFSLTGSRSTVEYFAILENKIACTTLMGKHIYTPWDNFNNF